jgi:hypothetical protein
MGKFNSPYLTWVSNTRVSRWTGFVNDGLSGRDSVDSPLRYPSCLLGGSWGCLGSGFPLSMLSRIGSSPTMTVLSIEGSDDGRLAVLVDRVWLLGCTTTSSEDVDSPSLRFGLPSLWSPVLRLSGLDASHDARFANLSTKRSRRSDVRRMNFS